MDASGQLALNMKIAREDLASRMGNTKLMAIRAQNPFVQIFPFPDRCDSIVLAPNVPLEFNIPPGTKLVRFTGQGGYYVTLNGNASVPTATDDKGVSAIYKPEEIFYYVEELQSFSLVAAVVCIVTIQSWTQL